MRPELEYGLDPVALHVVNIGVSLKERGNVQTPHVKTTEPTHLSDFGLLFPDTQTDIHEPLVRMRDLQRRPNAILVSLAVPDTSLFCTSHTSLLTLLHPWQMTTLTRLPPKRASANGIIRSLTKTPSTFSSPSAVCVNNPAPTPELEPEWWEELRCRVRFD